MRRSYLGRRRIAVMVSLLFLLLLTFCLGSLAAFPDPLRLTGSQFFVHDPSLVQRQSDGKYFLFTTHNHGGGIFTATNLAGYVHGDLVSLSSRPYDAKYISHTVRGPPLVPSCPETQPSTSVRLRTAASISTLVHSI